MVISKIIGYKTSDGQVFDDVNEVMTHEAPGAYKPMELILENIKETVDVIEFIKPIYNFKAGGD